MFQSSRKKGVPVLFSSPAEKLAWLFDHVYDKVNIIIVQMQTYKKTVTIEHFGTATHN